MLSAAQTLPGPTHQDGMDPIHYLVNDHMGESGLQWQVSHLLVELLRYYFEVLGRTMLVGGNQFIHYRQGDAAASIAPDVYVIEDETTPIEDIGSWKVWERGGKHPCLAVEVVSAEYMKDYKQETLDKYQDMGVRELFRYDPDRSQGPRQIFGRRRKLLTHFVRNEAGLLVEQPLVMPDRARSTQFGFWLVHRAAPRCRLLLGSDPQGLALFPTRAEAEAARAEAEAARAEAEAARAEAAAEREQGLLAEIERLRALIKE